MTTAAGIFTGNKFLIEKYLKNDKNRSEEMTKAMFMFYIISPASAE